MTLRSDRLHVIGQTAIKIFMSRGAQPCALQTSHTRSSPNTSWLRQDPP
ncbi:hypothetical protein [Chroococcidiopsis sp. CCALA 051]|nr:hypothetical protein [Chroococcidiopsis sp. CCALA 051]